MRPSFKFAMYVGIAKLFETLPLRFNRLVAEWAAPTFLSKTAKGKFLAANVTIASGGALHSHLPEHYLHRALASYGTYWAESAKLANIPPAQLSAHFVIGEGLEYLEDAYAQGRGVIVALPHIGSWDWGGAIIAHHGMPMTVVAEKLDPPALFEWFSRKRRQLGLSVVGLDEGAGKELLSVLKSGGVVGLLCDRDIQGGGAPVTFFGLPVTVPAGPATLALRTGAVLLTAACYIGPHDDHFAVIGPPIPAHRESSLRDDVHRVSQSVTTALEGLIQRAPEQWHVLEDRFGAFPA